jgi:MSHA biogenesis protein MshJ
VEKILVAKPELHVVRVESLPPDALGEVAPAGAGGKTDAASGDAGIYRYGMRIEFRGSYNDIVRYLAALEALPWKVFWGQMNVEMVKYPTLKLVLTVYTLGLSEEWAGEHPET